VSDATPVLETRDLVKHFPINRTLGEVLERRSARAIHAVDGVSVHVDPKRTLGLIGESGSGKTTLGWLVARLTTPTSGRILFEGEDITELRGRPLRAWHRNAQMVFQDPLGSLDPRLRVWEVVGEPMRSQERIGRTALRGRVAELLPTVGLPAECLDQYPHEFSGGGRQRLSLARALSVHPRLIILDEPTSALDVAVQAQILNRLVSLQREQGLAYLLITHNVAAVRYVAHDVAVMYLGEVVEIGAVREVLEHPVHPYTKALLAALPVPDPKRRRARYRIGGEIPTLVAPPPGCRFAPRCPFVIDRCRVESPPLREVPGKPGRKVSCHRAEEVGDIPAESLIGSAPARAEAVPAAVPLASAPS
jgi:oligopeptide/dipeptide ABC transporter ATP-binding protein